MKQIVSKLCLLMALCSLIFISSCSKSSSSGPTTGTPPGTTLFPLALNNVWNYKLRLYDTTTGATIDSSYFSLTITGKISANGNTYYQFQNSVDNSIIGSLANINSTTIGSIDSAYGINYYTLFVSGSGDSTQSVNSWPVSVSANGTTCEGTDKLYGYYADTTLVNNDGITYTGSMKNVAITYNCSGVKSFADVYFVKQGVGIVRLSRYIYSPSGTPLLESAWVLESETLN
jgi:hypothetical protein